MSRNEPRPRGRDAQIVALVVAGASTAKAAEDTGVSSATIKRTRARWADLIRAEREQRAEESAAALLDQVPNAVQALGELVKANVPAVRLRAATYILDSALRWRSNVEVEQLLRDAEHETA